MRSEEELLARWRAVYDGEIDLGTDRYELNERGEFIVTPKPSSTHQGVGAVIAMQFNEQLGALAAQGVSVFTPSGGIRAPDVIWMPLERWRQQSEGGDPIMFVPDVCVEVMSGSDSRPEMAGKAGWYLEGGAREVVVVDKQGGVHFWSADGESAVSKLVLTFDLAPFF
jgi:Uma2 family endonuclease